VAAATGTTAGPGTREDPLINPNTSRAMTATVAAAAREVSGADAEIAAVRPDLSAGGRQQQVGAGGGGEPRRRGGCGRGRRGAVRADLATGGSDAYVLACFGDPGLDAAPRTRRVPVIGIAEAAMHVAAIAGVVSRS
jgi:allantoin racemase